LFLFLPGPFPLVFYLSFALLLLSFLPFLLCSYLLLYFTIFLLLDSLICFAYLPLSFLALLFTISMLFASHYLFLFFYRVALLCSLPPPCPFFPLFSSCVSPPILFLLSFSLFLFLCPHLFLLYLSLPCPSYQLVVLSGYISFSNSICSSFVLFSFLLSIILFSLFSLFPVLC